jgi:4'-phosphopantetheinyl transferase
MMPHAATNDAPLLAADPIGHAAAPGIRLGVHADVHIVSVRLDQEPQLANTLLALLSDSERARATRFHFERDRRRFIITRGTLRELLGAELGVAAQSVVLEHGACGKPHLGGAFAQSGLHFNVSHSGDLAVIGLSLGSEIGVDVEALQHLKDADDLVQQCFSRREREEYARALPDEKILAFFNCWTRKEALVKALGQGLSYPLHNFDVSLLPGEAAQLRRLGDKCGADCGWQLRSFSPAAGFVAALAIKGSHNPAKVHYRPLNRNPGSAGRANELPCCQPVFGAEQCST